MKYKVTSRKPLQHAEAPQPKQQEQPKKTKGKKKQ